MFDDENHVEGCHCRYRVELDDSKTITNICHDHLMGAIGAGKLMENAFNEYMAEALFGPKEPQPSARPPKIKGLHADRVILDEIELMGF